ncbi:MAG: hypothetical protein PHY28_09770, partial [Dehalococcoidales bacterium]|nr:hypothetical protein [Dehalococcoidales bacterium]
GAMEMQAAGYLMIHLLHPQVPEEIQEAAVVLVLVLLVRTEGMDSILPLTLAYHRVAAVAHNGNGSCSASGNG